MKLNELKCKNCGAKIELEEGKTEVTCKYCNTTFTVDDEYTKAYKYTKGMLKAEHDQMQENLKEYNNSPEGKATIRFANTIQVLCFIVFIIALIIIGITTFNMSNNRLLNNNTNISSNSNDNFDAEMFNNTFYGYNGTTSTFFVKDCLDEIINSNKKEKKHIITVKYNDKETSNPDEILEIKKSLDDSKEYKLSMDYDSNGFFNKLTITE